MKRKFTDSDHECTSWIVTPDLTGGKTMLLHKNRDADSVRICLRHGTGKNGEEWISVSDLNGGVNMGLNSKGVAVAMNSGDPSDGFFSRSGRMGTTAIAERIMKECSTAAESVEYLKKIVREKKYYHGKKGSIWFIADARESYVAEHDALRFAVHLVAGGFALRANSWYYPEMVMYSQWPVDVMINHRRRELAVRNSLFDFGTAYKKAVTVEKIAAASRVDTLPEDPKCYPPCGSRTNSAATIEIDCEYPEFLSTIYASFGPPRYTSYLPVPGLLERDKIPEELMTLAFSSAVFARRDAGKELLPQDELARFERKMNKRHSAAVEAARKKLKAGGTKADAAKLLTAAFLRNWEDLRKLSAGK